MYAFSSPAFWVRFFREFRCPQCRSREGYVSRPRNLFEEYALRLIYLRTARCGDCYRRSYRPLSVPLLPRPEPMRFDAEKCWPQPFRPNGNRLFNRVTRPPINSGLREPFATAILGLLRLAGSPHTLRTTGRSSSAVLGTELGLLRRIRQPEAFCCSWVGVAESLFATLVSRRLPPLRHAADQDLASARLRCLPERHAPDRGWTVLDLRRAPGLPARLHR